MSVVPKQKQSNDIFESVIIKASQANKRKPQVVQVQPQHKFTFIDLFAGIGGFHVALDNIGGKCTFACEIDKSARETYKINHKIGDDIFAEDVMKVESADVPDHDILLGGFPCQSFSISAQNPPRLGYKDDRGKLFFEMIKVLKEKIKTSMPLSMFEQELIAL